MKPNLKQAINYIKESKSYIYWAIEVFIIGIVFGAIFADPLSTLINEMIKELLEETIGLNAQEMILFIMQNNLQSAFFSIIFGILLGIFPIFSSLTNGIVLGYVSTKAIEVEGVSVIWRLVPHGIFELPAIFISFGLGIKLGFTLLLKRKNKGKEFLRRIHESANVFLAVILPLIILAAIIEGTLIVFF